MSRHQLFSAILLLWVVAAVGGGIYRITILGQRIENGGPQALTSDRHGGFILATNDELLHFGPNQKLIDRHGVRSLGLGSINSITQEGDSTLWVYDADARRPYRCDENTWRCSAFGPLDLGLGRSIVIAVDPGTDHHVLLSDNGNDRILTLDSSGQLPGKSNAWWVPNQISATDGGFVLADTGHYQLVQFNDPGEKGNTLLHTHGQPYRFANRGSDWWVVEAGSSLNDGWVQYYDRASNKSERLHLHLRDAIAAVDTGSDIIIASKADWRLQALDPATNTAVAVDDEGIQQEFDGKAAQRQADEKQRGWLPGVMIAAVLPALLVGIMLQKRMDTEKLTRQPATVPPPRPTKAAPSSTPCRRTMVNGSILLRPDRQGFEDYQQHVRRVIKPFLILALALCLVLLAMGLAMKHGTAVISLASMLMALLALPPLSLYLQNQRLNRIYSSHALVCTAERLFLYENSKPVLAVGYDEVLLGKTLLVLGDRRLRWRLQLRDINKGSTLFFPVWNEADIREVLMARLPQPEIRSPLNIMAAVVHRHPVYLLTVFWPELLSLGAILLVYGGWLIQNGHRLYFFH